MSRLAVDLARALDPVALAEGMGMVPDPWQADVLRSDASRLLLNCSRQSGKTITVAVRLYMSPSTSPGALILLLSPSQRQSGELFRGCWPPTGRLAARCRPTPSPRPP